MEVANHPDSTIVLDPFRIYRDGGEIEDMKGIPGEKFAVFRFNDALAESRVQNKQMLIACIQVMVFLTLGSRSLF